MNAPDPALRLASTPQVTRATFDDVMVPTYVPSQSIPVRGEGSRVWDQSGRDLVDFAGGIAVSALGHCHPAAMRALIEQAGRIWHVANVMTNEPALRLALKLTRATFAERIFFCNSGAEANEAAFKLARRRAFERHGERKHEIVAAMNAFHGRTLFTVSVGGQEKYSKGFGPLTSGIRHVPYNDIDALRAAVTPDTCAIVLEPLQGEGGVTSGTAAYLQSARELATSVDALLILDEVQTGNGRTGTLYNYMQKGIVPDILTTAKGLGGGFPIGAMLTTSEFAQTFGFGVHGSTFGGNALACAVAEAVFDVINTPEVLEGVRTRGERLRAELAQLQQRFGLFRDIRGEGLLLGCELVAQWRGRAKDIVAAAETEGLLVLMAGPDVLRLAPSLVIPDADIDEGMKRFARALQRVT